MYNHFCVIFCIEMLICKILYSNILYEDNVYIRVRSILFTIQRYQHHNVINLVTKNDLNKIQNPIILVPFKY